MCAQIMARIMVQIMVHYLFLYHHNMLSEIMYVEKQFINVFYIWLGMGDGA